MKTVKGTDGQTDNKEKERGRREAAENYLKLFPPLSVNLSVPSSSVLSLLTCFPILGSRIH